MWLPTQCYSSTHYVFLTGVRFCGFKSSVTYYVGSLCIGCFPPLYSLHSLPMPHSQVHLTSINSIAQQPLSTGWSSTHSIHQLVPAICQYKSTCFLFLFLFPACHAAIIVHVQTIHFALTSAKLSVTSVAQADKHFIANTILRDWGR